MCVCVCGVYVFNEDGLQRIILVLTEKFFCVHSKTPFDAYHALSLLVGLLLHTHTHTQCWNLETVRLLFVTFWLYSVFVFHRLRPRFCIALLLLRLTLWWYRAFSVFSLSLGRSVSRIFMRLNALYNVNKAHRHHKNVNLLVLLSYSGSLFLSRALFRTNRRKATEWVYFREFTSRKFTCFGSHSLWITVCRW